MNVATNDEIKCSFALQGLKMVLDPEIGLNVVDLGLIYGIHFLEGDRVACDMTLTTQFCPMGESIVDGVQQSLQFSFASSAIDVNLTFDPPWNNNRISPEGRQFLNR